MLLQALSLSVPTTMSSMCLTHLTYKSLEKAMVLLLRCPSSWSVKPLTMKQPSCAYSCPTQDNVLFTHWTLRDLNTNAEGDPGEQWPRPSVNDVSCSRRADWYVYMAATQDNTLNCLNIFCSYYDSCNLSQFNF
jgi:hypothetical protein